MDLVPEPLYEVECILKWRKVRVGRRSTREFLVTWCGYPLDEAQWIPKANFTYPALVACGLDLPLAQQIHLVFHVSNLKRLHQSREFEREERLPSPMVVDGEEEYEVETILRHKAKGARCLYLVMWKGYPITEASWEPKLHLQNAPLILEDYLRYVGAEDQHRGWNRGNRKNS